MTNLERQLRLLANAGVDFIVIGGMAAVAHGSAQSTLALKRAAGRPEDLEAIAELELLRDRRGQ